MIFTCGINRIDYREVSVENIYSYFKNKKYIQVDTETSGRDPHIDKIVSLQLGDGDNQFFIDCRIVNILKFKDLLENNDLILQNAKFDYKMLKAAGIVIENIFDTMIAECVLYCGYNGWGYALDKLVERYCHIAISKEERKGFIAIGDNKFSVKQIEYGCTDVKYLEDIKDKQEIKIKELDLEYCINLEMQVIKALGDIEYNGMLLDKEAWLKNTEEYKDKLEITKKELDEIVINECKLSKYVPKFTQGNLFGIKERRLNINYDSPSQVLKIFLALGFNTEGTGERELSRLVKIDNDEVVWTKHDFFTKLFYYRKYAKTVSTYGESFLNYINPKTGRVHTSFWQVASTGRVTSGNKDENAPNVQNIPAKKEFRNAFIPRKGFKWVSLDYSGQELRLMADGSGEQGFIDVLNRGEDLHCYAGSIMFKKQITKADKELRNKAKTINFGKPYGMGIPKLADELQISIKESTELFKEYGIAFPVLNKWLEGQQAFAKKNKYSVTFAPCRRKRFYPDMDEAISLRKTVKRGDKDTWRRIMIIEGSTEREGGNHCIQGSGADITKESLVEARNLVLEYNKQYTEEVIFLNCTVHDEIDAEVREDLAEEVTQKFKKIMIDCGNKYVSKVKMEVEESITNYWSK